MARVLFVVDELPAPPRNGVTNTAYHHLQALQKEHEVSLFWIRPAGVPRREDQVKANRALVANLWILDLPVVSRSVAAWGEILGHAPYFTAAPIDAALCRSWFAGYDCEIIWAETIRPWSYVSALERCLPVSRSRKKVAAISDSLTAMLRSLGQHVFVRRFPMGARLTNALQWMRSWSAARMEARILGGADHILVQTSADRDWIGRISSGALLGRTHVISNGTNRALLAAPLPMNEAIFGHIGHLGAPLFAATVTSILDEILPAVQRRCPRAAFSFLSPVLPARFKRRLGNRPEVRHFTYLEDIRDFYQRVPVLIVRSGKEFGLITRTIEAMAAGVVVIGDRGAFNGITRFVDGVHGFVAESHAEVTRVLVKLFSGEISRSEIAAAARALIMTDFQWADRFETIQTLVRGSRSDPLAA